MYTEIIKIPKERIAVLIGKKGETKRYLEQRTHTRIKVSSQEGEVSIHAEDSFNTFATVPVIKAIARGFNPEIAIQLLKENYHLEIMDMRDFAKNSKKKMDRIRARLIGTQGKAREMLEQLTNTRIVIHGRTVAVIGGVDEVHIARQGVEKLLQGSPHSNVYSFIETQMRKLRE